MGHPFSLPSETIFKDVYLGSVKRLEIFRVHYVLRSIFHHFDASASVKMFKLSELTS